MKKRDDGAGPVTEPDRGQDLADRRDGRLRSTIRREAAAVSAVGPSGPNSDLYRGFGDGFSRAFELAVTPVVFGAMGYALDRWLGLVPVFTTIFVLVTVVVLLLRVWYGYVYRMQALEAAGPWADANRAAANGAAADG